MKSAILLFALVSSAAFAKAPPATAVEKSLVLKAYYACLFKEAAQKDDGLSDVYSVGRAIALNCRGELAEFAEVWARGTNKQIKEKLRDRFIAREGDEAGAMVLEHRRMLRERRAKPARPPVSQPLPTT
jgi:hypothetical protein